MLPPAQVEELLCIVAAMDRQTVVERLLEFQGNFPVDFTPQFLAGLTTDHLRHIYAALCVQCGRTTPEAPADLPAEAAV